MSAAAASVAHGSSCFLVYRLDAANGPPAKRRRPIRAQVIPCSQETPDWLWNERTIRTADWPPRGPGMDRATARLHVCGASAGRSAPVFHGAAGAGATRGGSKGGTLWRVRPIPAAHPQRCCGDPAMRVTSQVFPSPTVGENRIIGAGAGGSDGLENPEFRQPQAHAALLVSTRFLEIVWHHSRHLFGEDAPPTVCVVRRD